MAGNRTHNHKWLRLRRSIICRLKEELENIDVKIMGHVLTIVLLISVIAATVAWFSMSAWAKMSRMQLRSADSTDIEISLKSGDEWEDVGSILSNDSTAGFTISMPSFSNIYDKNGNPVTSMDSGIMAPGVYGEFSFYVKSVNDKFDACDISIIKLFEVSEDVDTESETYRQIEKMLDGHILCFGNRDKVNGKYVYSSYLSEDTFITVSNLQPGTEQKVTIYWVWPYEYQNLAEDVFADGNRSRPLFVLPEKSEFESMTDYDLSTKETMSGKVSISQVFDWTKFSAEICNYLNEDSAIKQAEYLSDWYDYGDTLIGNYVTGLSYQVIIKGVMADE
ncbi:MAG: hypothetical protein SPF70_00765 [Lachnospiraceae bacterium]|nr:hypothetical protein [Lachnospiraceae bacterium]